MLKMINSSSFLSAQRHRRPTRCHARPGAVAHAIIRQTSPTGQTGQTGPTEPLRPGAAHTAQCRKAANLFITRNIRSCAGVGK